MLHFKKLKKKQNFLHFRLLHKGVRVSDASSRPSKTSLDDQLMAEVAKGCSKSFAMLFETYGRVVLGYATRLMKNQGLAEDISQEVWVKVVKAAPSYHGQGQFKAWVLTLTRNLCFNKLKADKRLNFVEDPNTLPSPSTNEENALSTPETQMILEHDMLQVKEAIDSLPESQRLALTLLIAEDLNYESIADHLELSISATKSLIYRARQNVIKKLTEKEEAS